MVEFQPGHTARNERRKRILGVESFQRNIYLYIYTLPWCYTNLEPITSRLYPFALLMLSATHEAKIPKLRRLILLSVTDGILTPHVSLGAIATHPLFTH